MQQHRAIALVAALLVSPCSLCFADCSVNMVKGVWGWQGRGTAMMNPGGSSTPVPVPFASLGIMTVDHQGRYTATGKISVGGQIQDAAVSGSIQVNADCTAIDTYGAFGGTDRLVILDNGNEMQLMPTKHPLGPVAGRGVFRRIARGQWDAPCAPGTVRGSYGGTAEGTVMMVPPGQSKPAPAPFSGIISGKFQRSGAGTANSTASLGGTIVEFEFPTMLLSVNSDCTAVAEWTAISQQMPGETLGGTIMYIVLDGGKELLGMELTNSAAPVIVLQNLKRISMDQ